MDGALVGALLGGGGVVGLTLMGSLGFAVYRLRAAHAERARLAEQLEAYAGLADAEEAERVARAAAVEAEGRRAEHDTEAARLEARVREARGQLRQVAEQADLQTYGLYEPHYDFGSAEVYKERLDEVRKAQKAMVKAGKAATCERNWKVDGSQKEGAKMTKRQIQLMLRAFNGDADAAIAKVTHGNAENMERRIERAFDAVNALGVPQHTSIEGAYLDLRLAELRLLHEYRMKKQEEREAAREASQRMKEEQQAERELAKEQRDAEKLEVQRAKALAKAREELAALHGAALDQQRAQAARLEEAVAKLESELSEAIDRKARAIARAQQTRSGWVYVLSNIGSFGEGVFKIGLTRRFDPLERVRELASASVPFLFDVHCIVFSEDAPALEAALHRRFDDRRVNLVNRRKEYFAVSLDEIRKAMAEEHGIVSFTLEPEADEYRTSVATRQAQEGRQAS